MKNVTPAYDTQVCEESSICEGMHEFSLSSKLCLSLTDEQESP